MLWMMLCCIVDDNSCLGVDKCVLWLSCYYLMSLNKNGFDYDFGCELDNLKSCYDHGQCFELIWECYDWF